MWPPYNVNKQLWASLHLRLYADCRALLRRCGQPPSTKGSSCLIFMQQRKCTDRFRASAAALCALWDHYGFLWRIPGLMAFTSRPWFTACQLSGCPLGRGRWAEGGIDIKPVVKVLAVKTKSGTLPSHTRRASSEKPIVWKQSEKDFKCPKVWRYKRGR